MLLFEDEERTYGGPASYAEGSFSYYNRSARPEVGRVRDLLERWISAYPAEGRDELVQRLREDFGSFQSAFFELYLHALLVALGHEVGLHPALPGTSKRPDFLAVPRGTGEPCIVEAVLASDENDDSRRERELHDRIQDDINAFWHPDFFFVLATMRGRPGQYPRRSALHGFLSAALEGLDADDIGRRIAAGERVGGTLRRRFAHEGLVLEIYPWPKSAGSRGDRSYRSVGAGPVRVFRPTAREAIRTAIKAKAGRYGDVPYPYIIAVNCLTRWGVEEDEIREALLGREVAVARPGENVQFAYDGEGAFTHRSRPTNTRVSGVLICRKLAPHSVASADVCLHHHFAARRPYDGPVTTLAHARVVENVVRYFPRASRSAEELFALHPQWPYDPIQSVGSG